MNEFALRVILTCRSGLYKKDKSAKDKNNILLGQSMYSKLRLHGIPRDLWKVFAVPKVITNGRLMHLGNTGLEIEDLT